MLRTVRDRGCNLVKPPNPATSKGPRTQHTLQPRQPSNTSSRTQPLWVQRPRVRRALQSSARTADHAAGGASGRDCRSCLGLDVAHGVWRSKNVRTATAQRCKVALDLQARIKRCGALCGDDCQPVSVPAGTAAAFNLHSSSIEQREHSPALTTSTTRHPRCTSIPPSTNLVAATVSTITAYERLLERFDGTNSVSGDRGSR